MNGTRYGGITICDTQVFCVLTGCQRDPRVLGCHKGRQTFCHLLLECRRYKSISVGTNIPYCIRVNHPILGIGHHISLLDNKNYYIIPFDQVGFRRISNVSSFYSLSALGCVMAWFATNKKSAFLFKCIGVRNFRFVIRVLIFMINVPFRVGVD